MKQRHAFTLIELLVVIAIISILAAVLFPVFATAREKARQMSCLSNEKQLNLAVQQYTTDNDDCLPNQVSAENGDGVTGAWIYYDTFENGFDVTKGSLYPYVKSKAVYVCPDDKWADPNRLSYSMNACVAQKEPPTGGFIPGKSLASIENPSAIMLFGEEAVYTIKDTSPAQATSSTDDGHFQTDYTSFSTRHNKGSIISFVDGHTKWYGIDRMKKDAILTGGPAACQE